MISSVYQRVYVAVESLTIALLNFFAQCSEKFYSATNW